MNTTKKRRVFPFTAVIGQEEMKLALLLNVIDPRIGGVMIMGDRGTGKSTTIRALADLLPAIEVVKDDPYNSSLIDPDLQSKEVLEKIINGESIEKDKKQVPMVDLPLGATEDRLCGTIDIEKALSEGIKAFEPGLLAKANRGLLYVDEVNLLDDHLVDVLLDSAASGWNTVEREGVSVRHPARFVLIGSGNPEEGELRPQLLDRFGMSVEVKTVRDAELRVKVVDQRTSFDDNPDEFSISVERKQDELQQKVIKAQEILHSVQLDDDLRLNISAICGELDVDGLRGDIVTNRSARAIAAFEGRTEVQEEDIARVITCSLRHRLRKDPLEQVDSGERVIQAFCKVFDFDEKDNLSPNFNYHRKNSKVRIIGIDPGLGRVGYGIIELKNEKIKFLDCGVIETNKTNKEEDRLFEIFNDLNTLIDHWKPDIAAVEKFFFYKSSTTISVVQARGVIMMVLASKKIQVSEYAPSQVKLTIAGSGKASKKEVIDAVMYNLNLNCAPKPDDSADALAIALTKLNEEGIN